MYVRGFPKRAKTFRDFPTESFFPFPIRPLLMSCFENGTLPLFAKTFFTERIRGVFAGK